MKTVLTEVRTPSKCPAKIIIIIIIIIIKIIIIIIIIITIIITIIIIIIIIIITIIKGSRNAKEAGKVEERKFRLLPTPELLKCGWVSCMLLKGKDRLVIDL